MAQWGLLRQKQNKTILILKLFNDDTLGEGGKEFEYRMSGSP
jgi:hypothetical protein